MTTFATLNWRNYQGRGVEYTNVLYDSVVRNLAEGTKGNFVVFTDEPDEDGYTPGIIVRPLPILTLKGWWNKLTLFRDDVFPKGERVVFFDLDTVVTGSLDAIAAYGGGPFAILRDAYRPAGLQSSVMMWEAGTCEHIWRAFLRQKFPDLPGGDQEFIESVVKEPVILQSRFPGKFASYKGEARFGVPAGASVVYFHGHPRPHQADGWVRHVWKVGAGTAAQLELVCNTESETVAANIRRSENDPDALWLLPVKQHKKIAVICAGGPSLREELPSITVHAKAGAHVFGCNAVPHTLRHFGIKTDFHVVLDARPENAGFAEGLSWSSICLYASQCDASVHEAAKDRLILWHPAFPGVLDIVGREKERAYIGGGTTCGMKAITLAWTMGYREIHLYGFDSCYRGDAHHAYPQSLNDHETILDVRYNEKDYKCSPWMVQQAEDFEVFAPKLMDQGVRLHVHGTGLIPDIAAQFSEGFFRPDSADFRAAAILRRLEGIPEPNVAEIGVFGGDLSRRLLARRADLKLTMIDKWDANHAEPFLASDDFHSTLEQGQQDGFFEMAKRVTSFASGRVSIIRADSKDAARMIPDESLDLVFIDADHSYEGCKSDIEAYLPKVRPGGIISGHDYANDEFKFGPMVKRAVDEFVASQALDLELGENYTWFAVKPQETHV